MIIESSNVRKKKKKKEPPNVTKVLSNAMLELHNVRIEPSNVRKKIRKPPNVTIAITYPQKKRSTVELPIVII